MIIPSVFEKPTYSHTLTYSAFEVFRSVFFGLMDPFLLLTYGLLRV